MRPMQITRDVQIAFYAWNAGVINARREYLRDPFAGTKAETEDARNRMRAVRAKRAKKRAA